MLGSDFIQLCKLPAMPASLCLIIATFLWGSSFIALKYAIAIYDPALVIFLRMLTTLFLSLCLWRYVIRFEYRVGDWKYLIAMSLAEPCLYFLFEGHAMEYTSASQAGVISGSLFFAPFLLFIDLPSENQHNITALLSILYLGSFVTLGGYGMYNYAISKVSVLTAAAYSNLIPIFTLILSAIILNEVLNLWQWLSIFVVFVGVMISQRHQELVVDIPSAESGEDISTDRTISDIISAETNSLNSVPDANASKGEHVSKYNCAVCKNVFSDS